MGVSRGTTVECGSTAARWNPLSWSSSVVLRLRPIASAELVCALALGATASAAELKPFEASYSWSWHGMTVAVSTLRLEHEQGEKWVYRSKSEPRGMGRLFSERPVQESLMEISDAGVHPLTYKADDGTSATKRDADVKFDWEHSHVSGVYENHKVDMPMPPGVQDDLSVQIALMVELLRGRTPEKFSILSGDSVRVFCFSCVGVVLLSSLSGSL